MLSDVQKFNYLRWLLHGVAASLISGFASTCELRKSRRFTAGTHRLISQNHSYMQSLSQWLKAPYAGLQHVVKRFGLSGMLSAAGDQHKGLWFTGTVPRVIRRFTLANYSRQTIRWPSTQYGLQPWETSGTSCSAQKGDLHHARGRGHRTSDGCAYTRATLFTLRGVPGNSRRQDIRRMHTGKGLRARSAIKSNYTLAPGCKKIARCRGKSGLHVTERVMF